MQSSEEKTKTSSVSAAFIPRPTLLLSSTRASVFPFVGTFTCSPINEHYQNLIRFDSITFNLDLLGTFVAVHLKTSSKHITTKKLSIIYCLFNVAVSTTRYVVAEGKMI